MKALRLQNVRSLADTGRLEIKPLTILLGQNSSGKSTFLRSFPLLSQSIRTRSNAPILWFGDYVDFGSVHEVRSTFAPDDAVGIEVDLGIVYLTRRTIYDTDANRSFPISIGLNLDEADDKTRLRSFRLQSEDDYIDFKIDTKGGVIKATINGRDYTRLFPSDRMRFITSEFVPHLTLRPNVDATRGSIYNPYRRSVETADREIRKLLSAKLHGRISEGTITAVARRVRFQPGARFLDGLRDIPSSLKSYKNFVLDLEKPANKELTDELRALSFASVLPELLNSIELTMSRFASHSAYVGPSRATGERYYRMQELAVDQIDPQGKNLAMFLHSLNTSQMRNFSTWLVKAIGYYVKVERSAGHIQIQLRDETSKRFYNLADMGYGFSQVLPIMAQLWSGTTKRSLGPAAETLMAIEQPELHLHPAYQGKLADVFAKVAQGGLPTERTVKLIVETHSEALINRLGELVYDGAINPEHIAIYIFERSQGDEISKIKSVKYSSEGTLLNWPIGFFSAEV